MRLKTLPPFLFRQFVSWNDTGYFDATIPEVGGPVYGARLSRHDHHNLEIKAWVEPASADYEAQIDVLLFVPGSFQIGRWTKQDLTEDFRSRVRLALANRSLEHDGPTRAGEILERCRELLAVAPDPSGENYKQVGGLVGELLKHRGATHRRRLVMAHSLSIPLEQRGPELTRLLLEVTQSVDLLHTVRKTLQEHGDDPVLPLLDEYLSNFFVKYLGKLRTAMSEVDPLAREKANCETYREAWAEFERKLGLFQKEEAVYRQKFTERLEVAASSSAQEASVVRLSQLKKFFQSRMFVEVTRHSPSSRFLETSAILGTALAGTCWAVCQFYNRPDLVQTTNQGFAVLAFAVLTYVIRDRIKDRAKLSLHKRLQKWLPDTHQLLQAGGRTFGSIREWFHVHKKSALSPTLQELRMQACRGEMDKDLPEDVLMVRKVFTVHSEPAREAGWALQESTRINIERYLKHMDDPFKELSMLDASGELTRLRSRRVYHFHLAVELKSRPLGATTPFTERSKQQFYRVVLDKVGIDRLERIS